LIYSDVVSAKKPSFGFGYAEEVEKVIAFTTVMSQIRRTQRKICSWYQ